MKQSLYYILSIAIGLFILNACDDETETPAAESQQVMTFDIHLQANNCQGEPLANGYMLLTDARNIQYTYKMDDSGTVLADYPDDHLIMFPLTYTLYNQVFTKTIEEAVLTAGADEQFEALGVSVCENYDGNYLQMSFGDEHFLFDDLSVYLWPDGDQLDISFYNWEYAPPAGLETQMQFGGLGLRNMNGLGTYPMFIPDLNESYDDPYCNVGVTYTAYVEGGPSGETAYMSPFNVMNTAPDAALELTKIPDASGPEFRGVFSGEAYTYFHNYEPNTTDYASTTMIGSFRGTP